MKPKPARAVGYVRVSTEEQVDGRSLDAQRNEIERYCEREGFTLVGFYADEGVSAHTDKIDKRPQMAALLREAERRSFDVVLVHTLDRWARNIRVQSEALQRLGNAGVGFISLAENVDFSTATGRMMLTVMGGVSEFFSDQLGVHVLKSQRDRAEKGLPVGPVPFGYRAGPDSECPQPEERESHAVRRVFAMRASGSSNGAIAAWLNGEGFRTRTGRLFTAHAVKDLLNCRFYLGFVSFQGDEYQGRHEPLISPTVFEQVQARRVHRGSGPRIDPSERGALAGMIRCVRCGNSLHADRNRVGTPMYRERHGWPCETNRKAFVAPPVDTQIGQVFGAIELRNDWRERIARAGAAGDRPSVSSLLERRRRLARAYADGGYTLAEYEAMMAVLDAEIRLADQDAPVDVKEVADVLRDLPTMWREARADERRRLVSSMVTDVFVDVETRRVAGITPNAPFRALLESALERGTAHAAVLIAPDELRARGEYGLGGDGGELNSPSSECSAGICYGRSRRVSLTGVPPAARVTGQPR